MVPGFHFSECIKFDNIDERRIFLPLVLESVECLFSVTEIIFFSIFFSLTYFPQFYWAFGFVP